MELDHKRRYPAPQSVAEARTSGRVTSKELLGERNILIIEHGGREYRLRVTQQGKLILTA